MKIAHFVIRFSSVFVVSISTLAYGSDPNNCELGSHWVRQHNRKAYQRADGKFFSSTVVDAHCSKNPTGYDVWNSRFRKGRPLKWPFKQEVTSSWTEEEKERLLEALSYMPPELRNTIVKGLFRMKKSDHFPNPASGNPDGDIVLYDAAFALNQNLFKS